jgi:CheY-like chemotaxis protein
MTSKPNPKASGPRAAPDTVLLADDNGVLRESFAYWLTERMGWRVREAADGREAVASLDAAVDVVVLDRDMPKLTGDEVVDRLHETTFSGAVVVLSASRPDGELEDCVDEYLLKPVKCESLAAVLSTHLR